ncbi:DUF3179 domain-containing protein [Tranquillimonas alkanivorans]|uniref:DUF3179 domain-containing protein n=1 Tax=Tranquillimonas alkanivorans TaxID=441119 RepID=A0A1I5MHF2_9RHOB|nr:DUF3179 domain-containing protein [Tranquillimonas alkanivorans]SFP09014.1 Protein of unknown function [Tranquillimonas alkanivorans]
MRLALALACALALATAAAAEPERWRAEWPRTDFSTTSVGDWSEIVSGGPPRDGIPALSDPDFLPVAAERRLSDREPVIAVELGDAAPRAYPIRYLMWHEIVNDTAGGLPIAVTYCPFCNSGLTFDRRLDGRTLTFGVSGKLRASDMVMYDRETESWWQQALGRGIVGEMTGRELRLLPTWMESWAQFRERNPEGLVMAQPDWPRAYGRNPYAGYDGAARPFLYSGEMPPHGIPALARVVRVGERAWTFDRVRREGELREAGVTISWSEGQASALDAQSIGQGREVGTIRVRDGRGRNVPHDVLFAFAFHALFPQGEWMLPK